MEILLLTRQKAENYKKAVEHFGAKALINKYESLDKIDGLIICGGNDICPDFYGMENQGSVNMDRERDELELTITKAFLDTGKPILGICRGYQLLNVALGGTLIQHIKSADSHIAKNGADSVHKISAAEGTVLNKLYKNTFYVNSSHHQALLTLGQGLFVTAVADDGVIEAIEHESKPYIGVQFHPERMLDDNTVCGYDLFDYFLAQCKKALTITSDCDNIMA